MEVYDKNIWTDKKGRKYRQVSVLDAHCLERPCYYLLSDKGIFTPGRGYTSYYKEPRWVCGTRHLRGCPSELPLPVKTCYICGVRTSDYQKHKEHIICEECCQWDVK